jgi:hypothetical protein
MAFMGYLGDKTEDEWDESTSRRYMNKLWESFAYIPIQLKQAEASLYLNSYYKVAESAGNIIGFNHTNPHKSNPAMRAMYGGGEGDILIKSEGKLQIADCNGRAAVMLLSHLISERPFSDYTLVIIGGLGATGRLILNAFADTAPKDILICDIQANDVFIDSLEAKMGFRPRYIDDIAKIPEIAGPAMFVNATRHADARKGISIYSILERCDIKGNAALDLIMGSDESFGSLAMRTADGNEFAAWTNYLLTQLIEQAVPGLDHIGREAFRKLALL